MKNKESFLKELQSRLSVLEEAEQQDILAESMPSTSTCGWPAG